jgi:hypothetical protein
VAQIWPVGIDRIGSRIYFFFMAVNLVCVPVIYLLYPETKTRSLEDMDILFGGTQSLTGQAHDDTEELDVGKAGKTRTTADPVSLESGRRA